MIKRLLPLLCALLLLTGCGAGSGETTQLHTATILAMDTVMDLSVYGGSQELLDQARERVLELEELLSATDPDSEIYALNRTGAAELSEDTAALLNRGLELCRETEGALDLSIYPVVRAWGFTTGEYRVPEPQELAELLEHVDYTKIACSDSGGVTLPEGMELDLGGVAKGYTGDRLIELLRENGVTSALLNLGGNVQTLGSKPDGDPWRVAVQSPAGEGYLGYLSISDQAVITSGGYERYFEDGEGNVYWHIMDPDTGYPAKSGLVSVTVVGEEGVYCDALSTALFIMGEENAISFWRAHGDFELLLVTEDGRLLVTKGLTDRFRSEPEAGYELAVIEDA